MMSHCPPPMITSALSLRSFRRRSANCSRAKRSISRFRSDCSRRSRVSFRRRRCARKLELFDGDQTEREDEKGIDIHAVNRLAASYWKRFQRELPHPKMDALVRIAATVFRYGREGFGVCAPRRFGQGAAAEARVRVRRLVVAEA